MNYTDMYNLILDSGFRILDSGFWILDSGFRILDSGFRITACECLSGIRNLESGIFRVSAV